MNTKSRFNTMELTKMGLLTALICVSAYIVIPLPFSPASLTAQTTPHARLVRVFSFGFLLLFQGG